MAMGWWQRYIVGCYLALDDSPTIENVFAAVGQRPRGYELLVAGKLNTGIIGPEGSDRE